MPVLKHFSSSGALLLIVCLSFLFSLAVYKINNDNIQHLETVNHGICHIVAGANKNVHATRQRVLTAVERDRQKARAETQVAHLWAHSARHASDPRVAKLDSTLATSWETLAREDRATANDLRSQSNSAQPIVLPGC